MAAQLYGPDHRVVQISGARVVILDRGSGEATLLLHGYPQSHLMWRFVVEALAAEVRVIAPDWPGWGRSTAAPEHGYDYDSEVARVVDLLDALAVERVNLIGHDYGGYLGLGVAIRHPTRVARLAILNSRAHQSFPGAYRWVFAALGAVAISPGLSHLIFAKAPLAALTRRALERALPLRCRDPSILAEYTAWMDQPEARRWLARFHAGYTTKIDPSLAAGLAGLRCPTAIIWGDRDPWCPPKIAEDLAARIHGSRLTRLANAGHFVVEEQPDAVLTALHELLTRPADPPAWT